MAEILVLDPLGDFRIAFVRIAHVQRDIGAVERGVEVNGIVAFRRVLQEYGQLGQRHVAFLVVVLTGDGTQVGDFGVLGQ